jgi:hypothetical protein
VAAVWLNVLCPHPQNLQREEQQVTTGRGELKEAVDSKQMANLYVCG